MNSRTIAAIMNTDLKDLVRNMALLPLIFIPPLLAFIMGFVSGEKAPVAQTLPMWIVYGQILVGMNIIALGLAEEKEKKTLEALMVSPAGLGEIIVAKLGFTIAVGLVVEALTIAVGGGVVGNPFSLVFFTLIGMVFFSLIGLIIGVFSPNQKAAGALSTPFMLAFLLGPMVVGASELLKKVLIYLPSLNLLELLHAGMNGEAIWTSDSRHLISFSVWMVLAGALALWAFQRQRKG